MTLAKDGSPLSGVSNIESKEKITPPQSLNPDEEKLNVDNEWLDHLRGDRSAGHKAVRTVRLNSRSVSRSQRKAVVGEGDGPTGHLTSRGQRKVVKGGK